MYASICGCLGFNEGKDDFHDDDTKGKNSFYNHSAEDKDEGKGENDDFHDHVAEELWRALEEDQGQKGKGKSKQKRDWPDFDKDTLDALLKNAMVKRQHREGVVTRWTCSSQSAGGWETILYKGIEN